MNPNDNSDYDPNHDENQSIFQLKSQPEGATTGVSQAAYMEPVTAQGPEPEKDEINDDVQPDVDTDWVNDDMLEEEAVEDGAIDEEEE